MPEQRHVFRLSRSLVVALPPAVQRHLGVSRGRAVYWWAHRKGEAILTRDAKRIAGRPDSLALRRELDAALAEIAYLRQRNEARDRSMYAEGYSVGRTQAHEALVKPHGASAERQRQRRLRAYIFPEAAEQERRAQRRAVETVPGPDQLPATPEEKVGRFIGEYITTHGRPVAKPPALPAEK